MLPSLLLAASTVLVPAWALFSGPLAPGNPVAGPPATGSPATGSPATGTPATGTLSPGPQTESSPLALHRDRVERGQRLLGTLVAHMAPPRNRMEVTVKTEAQRRAHTARPDLLAQRASSSRVRIFALENVWQVESTTAGGPGSEPAVAIACNGMVCAESLKTLAQRLRANLVMRAPFPQALAHFVSRHGRVVDAVTAESETTVLVDLAGGQAMLKIVDLEYDGETVPGLAGVDWLIHDPLLGDCIESLEWELEGAPAPGVAAGWSITGPLGANEQSTVSDVQLDSGVGRSTRLVACEALADEMVSIAIESVGPDAYELVIDEHDARVLALATPQGWVVLEAPVSSQVGEGLIAALEEERPGLAVAYVAVSHHHPHYIGALRPFVARGATVVCPDEVGNYVEHILRRPRTLEPDQLASIDVPITIERVAFGDRWAPAGLEDTFVAIEAGGASPHTEAHLTFILPSLDIAFGGDLLWVSADETRPVTTPRTLALMRMVESSGYEVNEYFTSWPVEKAEGAKWRHRVMLRELRTRTSDGSSGR